MIVYSLTIDELKNINDLKQVLEYIKNNASHVTTVSVLFEDGKKKIPISIHVFASINQDLSNRLHFAYIENEKKEPLFVGYAPYTNISNIKKWTPIAIKSLKTQELKRLYKGYNSGKIKIVGFF